MVEITAGELDAILISRLLGDEDRVLIGAGLPAPRAGALLAALTHAPGLRICQSLSWVSLEDGNPPPVPQAGMDVSQTPGAEALLFDHEAFDDVRRLSTFFVIGGLEIDAHGATNLLGEYRDGRWQRRGPGPIGTTTMAAIVPRTVAYATRHTPAVFVERCAVRSTPGWQPNRGIAGPELCISPAGIFDFPAPEHRMRLIHHRPGWTPTEIAEATGFELDGLAESTPVEMPTEAEIETLRSRVDREGNLR